MMQFQRCQCFRNLSSRVELELMFFRAFAHNITSPGSGGKVAERCEKRRKKKTQRPPYSRHPCSCCVTDTDVRGKGKCDSCYIQTLSSSRNNLICLNNKRIHRMEYAIAKWKVTCCFMNIVLTYNVVFQGAPTWDDKTWKFQPLGRYGL